MPCCSLDDTLVRACEYGDQSVLEAGDKVEFGWELPIPTETRDNQPTKVSILVWLPLCTPRKQGCVSFRRLFFRGTPETLRHQLYIYNTRYIWQNRYASPFRDFVLLWRSTNEVKVIYWYYHIGIIMCKDDFLPSENSQQGSYTILHRRCGVQITLCVSQVRR